jgi:HEAT repeat protein
VSDDASRAADAARRGALGSADARVRLAALEELARAARPLGEDDALAVVDCLGVAVKALQRRATDVLESTAEAARPALVAALRAALASPEAPRRWGATYALGRLGIIEPALVPPLLEALGSRDGDQRWAAAALMVACGVRHPAIVRSTLLDALGAAIPELRKMTLYVLRDLALAEPAVVDAIVAALRDDDANVRLAALSAVTRLAPLPASACEEVLRLVRDDPQIGVRRAAVSALGHVGRGVASAAAAIAAALDSSDVGVRRAAVAARRRLEGAT